MPPSSSRTSLHSCTARPHPPLFRFLLVPMLLLLLASGSLLTARAETDVTGIPVTQWSHLLESSRVVEGAPGTALTHRVAPNGDVVALGFDVSRLYLARFAAETGELVWRVHPQHGPDLTPADLELDPQGNAFVRQSSPSETPLFRVEKYSFENGALLWTGETTAPALATGVTQGTAMAVDPAGDVLVVGGFTFPATGKDVFVAKYSGATGITLWTRTFATASRNQDQGTHIACDQRGDVIVGGWVQDYYNSTKAALVIKVRGSDGVVVWSKTYQTLPSLTQATSVADLAVDDLGNALVMTQAVPHDFYSVLKYSSSDGTAVWTRDLSYKYSQMEVDSAGHIYVSGVNHAGEPHCGQLAASTGLFAWTANHNGLLAISRSVPGRVFLSTDSSTTALNAQNGDLLWSESLEAPPSATSLACDAVGNVTLFGRSPTPGLYHVRKGSAEGSLLWHARDVPPEFHGSELLDFARHAPSGGVVLATYTPEKREITLSRRSRGGEVLWSVARGDISSLSPPIAAHDNTGNALVYGKTVASGGTTEVPFLAKYAAEDGAKLWEVVPHTWGGVVAVTSQGDIYFCSAPGTTTATVRKYAAQNGALLREATYEMSGALLGRPFALVKAAPHPAGHLVLSLHGQEPDENNRRASVVLLDRVTGRPRWEQHFSGNQPRIELMEVDGSGNIVVGGTRQTGWLAKVAGGNGAVLWDRRALGSRVTSLACGGNGHIAVTVADSDPQERIRLCQLGSSDGQVRWSTLSGVEPHHAYPLRADDAGNIVIAGERPDNQPIVEAYRAADGAKLWELPPPGILSHLPHPKKILLYEEDSSLVIAGSSTASSGARLYRIAVFPQAPDISVSLLPAGPELISGVSVLNYGQINVAQSLTKSLVVSNVGNARLEISGIELAGTAAASFRVEGGSSFTVSPGESHTLSVTALLAQPPPPQGVHNVMLVLRSDDPDEPEFRVPLLFHHARPALAVTYAGTPRTSGEVIALGLLDSVTPPPPFPPHHSELGHWRVVPRLPVLRTGRLCLPRQQPGNHSSVWTKCGGHGDLRTHQCRRRGRQF